MPSENSPLENLTAFAIVFAVGVLSTVGFGQYIERVKRNVQRPAQLNQNQVN